MREAFFILVVVAGLFALTAVRYRRQISTLIGFYREMSRVRSAIAAKDEATPVEQRHDPLVCCQKCRKWVPESGAIRFGKTVFYCSQSCMTKAAEPDGVV
jgi:hypothetical protein